MALDLSTDYLAVDLYEPITIVSRRTAPGTHQEDVKVSRSFWGQLTTKELAASSGAAVRMESAVDVPRALLEDYAYKPGDQIINQDNETYNIYTASKDAAWYRFVVYNPKIAYDLRHEVDWFDIAVTKDASGASVVDGESLLYESVTSRVQWDIAKPSEYAGRTGEERQAIIYSSERLYLTHNSIARWVEPETNILYEFDIIDWRVTDRLDELMQIRVVAKP